MSAKEPTPYERFVEATKAILSVPKKEVDKAIRQIRSRRKRQRDRKRD